MCVLFCASQVDLKLTKFGHRVHVLVHNCNTGEVQMPLLSSECVCVRSIPGGVVRMVVVFC